MQSYNFIYTPNALIQLPVNKINAAKSILIQVFSARYNPTELESLRSLLETTFPNATIIGTTTAGNIIHDMVDDSHIALSITTFNHTDISLKHLKQLSYENSYQSGEYLAEEIISKDTKALIIFGDHKTTNGQAMIEGIRSVNKKIVISGGIAGINSKNKKTLLMSNHGCSSEGIVCIALNSMKLHVNNQYKNGWIPFGKKLLITHAVGNRIYSIDHTRAADLFKHYLGENAYAHFETSRILFPLLKTDQQQIIARTPLKIYDDGSIEFAGEIKTGEIYQIGFVDIEELIQEYPPLVQKNKHKESESLFVYSCVSRKKMLKEDIVKEIRPLSERGNVSGFFTYGEFYADHSNGYLLNQTMTVLALSEAVEEEKNAETMFPQRTQKNCSTLNTLSHLMAVTNSELQEYHSYLQEKETLLCQGPVVNFKIDLHEGKGCTYVSKNIQKLLGYSTKEIICGEVALKEIFDETTLQQLYKDIQFFRKDKNTTYETEVKAHTKYGDIKYLHLVLSMQKNNTKHNDIFIGYCIDITKQVENQQKIQKLAFYDHITGLPNRELLKSTLQRKIDEAIANDTLCAVTFFDLDKFKDVNDTYGHSTGDKLLQLIANRVKAILKTDDFIARIGGDEFILIHGNLNKQTIQNNILATINRILTLIHEPFNIDGKIAHISTSIGTAIYKIDGENVEDLIKHADMAMYEAKKDPHIHFKFYSHTMRLVREEELNLKNALKKAVKNKDFNLLYQPQVDINSGKIIGAEALIRWEHPTRGMISPVTFIPLAEKMNLIIEIGEWLLEEVCHKINALQNDILLPETFKSISIIDLRCRRYSNSRIDDFLSASNSIFSRMYGS